MKHMLPLNLNGKESEEAGPYCFGVDICTLRDLAECPAVDWCYVDKVSGCVLPMDWCDPTDED